MVTVITVIMEYSIKIIIIINDSPVRLLLSCDNDAKITAKTFGSSIYISGC